MTHLLPTPKMPTLPPAVTAPTPTDPAIAAAAQAQTAEQQQAMGRMRTILTGPLGVTAPSAGVRKTLLGS